jgi:hypothetical protein
MFLDVDFVPEFILRSQYLLLLLFFVRWTCYFDCLGLAVFVVPELGNGPVFILVIFVMLSTHGLKAE